MATHAHSTTAPAVQPRLLPFVFRPVPPVDDPRSADELLEEIRRTIEGQSDRALAAAESTASQPCSTRHLAPDQALPSTAHEPLLPAPAPLPSLSTAFSRRRAIFGALPIDEPDTAAEARALHMRQQANAAIVWGFAFLDAFDLGPLALDVIDGAIAEMDRDDGDPDLEPWLADVAHFASGITSSVIDAEDDSEEDEGTALESYGRALVRAGADDAEDSHDDEPSLGARNPTWGSLGDSVSQVGWAMDSDDTDREHESSDAEPYLSVVEFDGRGDNWSRTGNATSGYGTDVEDANEDGSDDGRTDPGWCLGEMDVALVVRGMFEDARRGVHA